MQQHKRLHARNLRAPCTPLLVPRMVCRRSRAVCGAAFVRLAASPVVRSRSHHHRELVTPCFFGTNMSSFVKPHSLTISRQYSNRPRLRSPLFTPKLNFAPFFLASLMNAGLGSR